MEDLPANERAALERLLAQAAAAPSGEVQGYALNQDVTREEIGTGGTSEDTYAGGPAVHLLGCVRIGGFWTIPIS